jgi:hypothetical protein
MVGKSFGDKAVWMANRGFGVEILAQVSAGIAIAGAFKFN